MGKKACTQIASIDIRIHFNIICLYSIEKGMHQSCINNRYKDTFQEDLFISKNHFVFYLAQDLGLTFILAIVTETSAGGLIFHHETPALVHCPVGVFAGQATSILLQRQVMEQLLSTDCT